jgi:hypothetical protein
MAAADLLLEVATTRDDFIDAFTESHLVCAETAEVLKLLPADVTIEEINELFGRADGAKPPDTDRKGEPS